MQALKKTSNIYLMIVSFLGISLFFLVHHFQFNASSKMVITFALIGTILLLNHYTILIPPEGNSLSMDSAIYLASIFLFGLDLTLDVLFLNSIIYASYHRKVVWWKHVFNFSIYFLMILSSYYLFILCGGVVGDINTTNLLPYILSLSMYFILNMSLMIIYFWLSETENLINIIRGIINKSFLVSYFSILLLAIILGILIDQKGLFGLFLFVCIAMLLSIAFNQHFQLFQAISNKANKDYLTGLNNHGYFKEVLEKEVSSARESGQPLSIALLDLDDFKKYNDLYGHIQGDHLLKEFGTLLETEVQAKNYIAARYGGEEFTILMPNTNSYEALSFLDRLRKKANDTYVEGVEALPYGCLSFSAGIVEYQQGTYNTSELLNKADQAMYFSKAQGKNMVHIFNEQSDYSFEECLSIEKELEEAEQQLKIFLSKDVYTYRHSKRVFQYAVDFSRKLNLSDHERKIFTLGALVHDIGKLEVPRDILNKKGKLDPHEWEITKKHVIWGKEIISTNKQLEELIPLVELHHERYDGKGYPYGLKGENIPKLARLLCIIDSFDAMTTERPYQKTKTFEEAIQELRACSGNQFDPKYVEPFIELIEQHYLVKEEKVLT
ncbi:diguanylate cyclase [Bacillus methanolicus]|uniref:Diguanylate cyclase and metal dependent phosphohydrolase n=1 Tax=Bacillus methanolicus (strain MGA3 / ATCC 53907) TaxID=796606 RepID=I3EB50_BACMM|nr:diguanylate cyclase [Bacillus methanolicus]AIE61403.1 diguanylate cyclase and metal dependent phosphohydrolase [Bacillus methanolicus MGA3]EIJ83721.1 diguanylate cyclase and metal dependent phosphohydrolase [Bacillus methanolicus MGA3]